MDSSSMEPQIDSSHVIDDINEKQLSLDKIDTGT